MKKRLLITLTYYAPHLSGLTIAAKNLAELLAKNTYEVTVLTTRHTTDLPLQERIEGVNIHRIPYLFTISKGFLYPFLLGSVIREVRKTDVVMIHLPQVEGVLIAIIAKLWRKKLLCFYHCTVTMQGNIFEKIIERVMRYGNFITLYLADTVFVTSMDFAENDNVLKRYSHKIVQTYPVVGDIVPGQHNKDIFGKLVANKKYRIGFIGRIAREKGIQYLLSAIPLLRERLGDDFVILIGGDAHSVGEEKYAQQILKIVHTSGGFARYVGMLPAEAIGNFYTLLDVLVVPSINSTEAFGMVQVEAMRFGVPVVATDLPGVRVCVRKTGMGEIVPIRDKKTIAEAITEIVLNPEVYRKEKRVIDSEFSNQKILAVFESIFVSEKSSLSDDRRQ